MSKQIAPKNWVPAVWVIAIAMVGFAAIAGASHLRPQHNGNANVAKPSQTARSAEQRGRTRANLDALPLAFEANQGQTDPQVKYMARGNGYTAFLTANETVFAMQASTHANPAKWTLGRVYARPQSATQDVNAAIRMKLVGANPRPKIAAENELPGHSNYFIGNDPSKWQSGVKQYSRVSYSDVYPGVNLAFHGQQRQLEFDFIVAPGAKAESIRFNVAGAKRVSTDTVGNLVLSSAAGDVVLHKPITYQTQNNLRQPVPSHFVVANDTIGFEVGNYDRSRELVIDPSVTYSTYLGGNAEDDGIAIAVNGSGNAFITGETKSTNFPTMNGLYSSKGGGFDVFVTELSPDGSTLIYSTYIGGSSDDSGNAIAVDGSGNAFVAGGTTSANFPTQGQGTWQGTFGGGTDGFVLELNSTGSALTYSTFLGGSGTDAVSGLALDGSGNAYAVGQTTSTDFPTNNAKQPSIVGTSNGFVSKIGFGGSNLTLDYSTYLGGGTGDLAVAVAVDGSNQAYVTGATKNKTFPTTAGAFQTSCGSDGNCNGGLYDAFVTVFNAAGSNYVYSTFLGGEGNDQGFAIAVDGAGDAYLTGLTSSTKFPLQSAIQKTFGGGTLPADAFVTELNPTGSALVYSTYLGGTGDDTGAGIAVDSSKNVYVTGQTSSSNFPVSNATQATKKGQNDAFVTEISTGGSAIAFSTYLGGSLNEDTSAASGGGAIGAIAVDAAGSSIYVTGNTTSTDFPTQSAKQNAAGGLGDAYVTKYTTGAANFTITNGALSPSSGKAGISASATITVAPKNGFTGTVQMACSVSPSVSKGPTCSFTNSSISNASGTTTLNVATTAAAARLELPLDRHNDVFFAMILPVFGITLLGAGVGSSGSRGKKLFGLFLLGLVMMGLLLMPGCSSSSTTVGNGGTPAGTYTINVTGSSGGATANGSPAITLAVN